MTNLLHLKPLFQFVSIFILPFIFFISIDISKCNQQQQLIQKWEHKVFIQNINRDSIEKKFIREAANLKQNSLQQTTYKDVRTYINCK